MLDTTTVEATELVPPAEGRPPVPNSWDRGSRGYLYTQLKEAEVNLPVEEALELATAYLEISRAAGDEQTTNLLLVASLYYHLELDRPEEAKALGEELVRSHHATMVRRLPQP